MGLLHNTQHIAADVWQYARGGGEKENETEGGRDRSQETERGKGIVGGGKRKMTKVKRERGRDSTDRATEEEVR